MAFPTDLSDVTTGDDITASRNNAITNKIGVDNSAVATSLDYLIKNTSSKLGKIASLSDSDGNFIVGSASGWVAESGSTARTSIGLGSVENTALSTWAGTTNITTLGTITTGTWSGTAVAVSKGGTGSTTASAARTALGVAIGSDVQAYDADLTELAGLSDSDGNFIVGSASGWVAESGATARTSIGLGSVENTALSTWAGTTNVTTLGTVSTGTWTGTVVADEYGGTGQSAYAAGDILYASGANVLARLAISVTEDHVLSVSSGGLPEWAAAGGGGGATAFDGSAPAATNAATITVSDASDPALTITQSGAGNALSIYDGTDKALQVKDGGDLTIGKDAGAVAATTAKLIFATHQLTGFYPNIEGNGQSLNFNGVGPIYSFKTSGNNIMTMQTDLIVLGRSGGPATVEVWGDDIRTRSITGENGRIRIKFGGWALSNEVVSGLATSTDDVGGLFTADRGTVGANSQGAFRAERPDGNNYLWLWPDNNDDWRVLGSEPSASTDGVAVVTSGSDLAQAATSGFAYIPHIEAAPSGTPATVAGRAAMAFDEDTDTLYIRGASGWVSGTLT